MPKFQILYQPDHFIKDVNCPYCKQPSLGVDKTYADDEEKHARFTFRCVNADCVTNFMSPVAWELDDILEELFGEEARPGVVWSNSKGFLREEQ